MRKGEIMPCRKTIAILTSYFDFITSQRTVLFVSETLPGVLCGT